MGRLARMTRSARKGNPHHDRVPVFSLGERIRKVREDLGLSQQQFADQLGVDRKTVGNWEADRNQPRYRDLMMISSVGNVSLQWLAGELFRPQAAGVGAGADNSQESRRNTREYVPVSAAA